MLSKDEVEERLRACGYSDAQVGRVARDVADLICTRFLDAYVSRLPESDRARVREMNSEQLVAFIQTCSETIEPLSPADFERIHDDTWKEYFSHFSK